MPNHHPAPSKQDNDLTRSEQNSHQDQQKRSKKDGHTSQIGTGQDQNSSRHRGQGARRGMP